MKNKLFTFREENGEWKSEINPKYLFELYSVHGMPPEITLEAIEKLTIPEILALKLGSWQQYAKDNNVDLDSIREHNLEVKDKLKSQIEEYIVLHNEQLVKAT